MSRDHGSGGGDVGKIGLAVTVERCRYTNCYDVGNRDLAEIAARPETSGFEHRLDIGVRDVLDIGVTRIELLDLFIVDIQSDDWKALFRYGAGKRQPHVAHAADSDGGRFLCDFPRQRAVLRGLGFGVGLGFQAAVD